MRTLFELETKPAVDMAVFEQMKKTAETALLKAETDQYSQSVVLLSAEGNEYSILVKNALSEDKSDENALLEKIENLNDTVIQYILCLWQDGGIDIPSYGFREKLCASNPKNTDSLLFVMTADGVSGVRTSTTMK